MLKSSLSSSSKKKNFKAPAAATAAAGEEDESDQASLREMIDDLVCGGDDDDDTSEELDLQATMDLTDRLDSFPNERKEALKILEEIFKTGPSPSILRSVKLLESIVKNCSHGFFKDLASKQFQEAFLKLLDRKRRKKSFFKSIKQNTKNWDEIEKKVLYLIQLWYDTFMMHEADFPHIMNNYKLLRKEGIQFPERSVNEIHMINFKGIKSPILQVLEDKQMQQSDLTVSSKKDKHGNLPGITTNQARTFVITQDNIDLISDNLLMLTAIIEGAQYIEDLQTEYALEMIQTLKTFIAKIELMTKEGSLSELKSSKEDILGLAEQANQIVDSHIAKKEDIELVLKAIQASAIEEFSRVAHEGTLELSKDKPKSSYQSDAPQPPPQIVSSQSSKEVNLLDLEEDDFVQPGVASTNSNIYQQSVTPLNNQPNIKQVVQLQQPQQQLQKQQQPQSRTTQEVDLFGDFLPNSVSKANDNNPKAPPQQHKQAQQDDFDDFLSSIVK